MLHAATLSLLVALASGGQPEQPTVWLVQPLYPGQDYVVSRSEESLARLMTGEANQLVGTRALVAALEGKRPSLGCLTGEEACIDSVDAFVASLGLGRIVLLKGGQEEATYRFKVTSYVPKTGELLSAEGSGGSLERALLAAMVKVVPLSARLKVETTPTGATLFVDGEKVGVTPYSGQILPGERKLRLQLTSHLDVEKSVTVPVRGALDLLETLEKVPARLVVVARPAAAGIMVDGKRLGAGKVDQPIQPGRHRVVLELEGHLPLTDDLEIKPGETFTFEKELQPTGWTSFKRALSEAQEEVYGRSSYFQVNYEQAWLWGDALYARKNPTKDSGMVAHRLLDDPTLGGFSMEYGQDGRYFGLLVAGAGYYYATVPAQFTLENEPGAAQRQGGLSALVLRGMQPHLRLAFWRFSLIAQAGLEGRVLWVSPEPPAGSSEEQDGLFAINWQLTTQVGLRMHVFHGAYLEGVFRHSWTPFQDSAAFQGFHGGVGYAF